MSLLSDIFKKKSKVRLEKGNKITYADLFRWQCPPRAPLMPEELLELEIGFKNCDGDCPIAIIFTTLMNHIKWQENYIKNVKENYDK